MNAPRYVVSWVALAIAAAVLPLLAETALADVKLPAVIGSNMVFQRDKALPIWGWAEPGEKVTVEMAGNTATAAAGKDGKWTVRLNRMAAGGPHVMSVQGRNTIKLENILVGEVWVCSGQSNMEWSVRISMNAEKEIAAAQYPRIRLFHVPKRPGAEPESDVNAAWKVCSPETIPGFSAVAYFYGRSLHKELGVPIGLINSSWGGTRIEPWTPPEGFALVPALADYLKPKAGVDARQQYRKALKVFLQHIEAKMHDHLGTKKKTKDEDDEFAELDDEAEEEGTPDLAILKPVDPQLKNAQRIEKWLPSAKQAVGEGKAPPPLPGGWPRGWPILPANPSRSHGRPSALYNGMIHPLLPFAIRGAIWYQGESNRGNGLFYQEMMKGLIYGWRKVWAQDDFPFYYTQLAPFTYGGDPALLAEIWEAQTKTLAVPNTGMAVITDIGNIRDIHPRNKQEVGRRLSLWALARAYGTEGLVYSGPLYKSMSAEGSKIRISFEHVGGGLASRDGKPLTHFTIAGLKREFVPAEAEIDGNTVVVSADGVPRPAAVRFAWHQQAEPNLMNKEGLPASPFRTDQWSKEEAAAE